MKPTVVSADVLFEDFRGSLSWEWVAGLGASERRSTRSSISRAQSAADLVGYLNYIHPYRVQILGAREIAYLTNAARPKTARAASPASSRWSRRCWCWPTARPRPTRCCRSASGRRSRCSPPSESSAFVIDVLRAYLSKHFAERTSMHGVFMDILGLGVMITGESGLGKSELGLELISRGNGLVADDAVDLYRINQTTIEGRCPELLQNLLEVRGIGLLDIRAHLRRDGGAPQDAAQADRAPGAPRDAGARVRAPALRAADAGRAGRAGAQGRSSRWWPAATSPCWWKRRCATPSCSCAASTPTPTSSARHRKAMEKRQRRRLTERPCRRG